MFRLAALLSTVLLAAPVQDPSGGDPALGKKFAVLVNAGNTTKLAKNELVSTAKKLYLKNLSRWPDGSPARPYARASSSDAQQAFAHRVLKMTDAELARHWLRLKNMRGTTPPREVSSDRLVIKHVARKTGAFAIVEASAVPKSANVRVLFEF